MTPEAYYYSYFYYYYYDCCCRKILENEHTPLTCTSPLELHLIAKIMRTQFANTDYPNLFRNEG